MNLKRLYPIIIFIFVVLAGMIFVRARLGNDGAIEKYTEVSEYPRIRPDYTDTVIPSNIAPLNFMVCEPGTAYLIKIRSDSEDSIEIFSRKNKIRIPQRKWKALLKANRGKKIYFDVYVRSSQDDWKRYQPISNPIAGADIDSHIAYRLIEPVFNSWGKMGIYQRNLENFDESAVVNNHSFEHTCINCHSFANNNPDTMVFGVRSGFFGSAAIMSFDGKVDKIGTKFGYTAWHPTSQLATYSTNRVQQFFHSTRLELRDVVDLDSYIAYYSTQNQTSNTTEALTEKNDLESYPTWSPDGRYLYYCSAPILWFDRYQMPPARYDDVRYNLMRISYDLQNNQWGQPETVLSANKTRLSILLPRISPDGKYLLFCMCKYGCFPVFQPSSDLYMMNLETGRYKKLDINSEYSESWHSWSSNSRWIAFSSKREDGLFTRTYISYVDETGKVFKPFVLPQKDPAFYDSYIKTFSVPELITGPVTINPRIFSQAIRKPATIEVASPITGATAQAPALEPWQERE